MEPVPDSSPASTCKHSPDTASNSLTVESWPPLRCQHGCPQTMLSTHAATIILPSRLAGDHSSVLILLFSVPPLTTANRLMQYSDPGATTRKSSSVSRSFGCLLGDSDRLTVPRSAG